MFGLGGEEYRPPSEIAKEEGVSAKRIRQIIVQSLKEIRWHIAKERRHLIKPKKSEIIEAKPVTREQLIEKYRELRFLADRFFKAFGYSLFEGSILFRQLDKETMKKLLKEINDFSIKPRDLDKIKSEFSEVFEQLEEIKDKMETNSKEYIQKKEGRK